MGVFIVDKKLSLCRLHGTVKSAILSDFLLFALRVQRAHPPDKPGLKRPGTRVSRGVGGGLYVSDIDPFRIASLGWKHASM